MDLSAFLSEIIGDALLSTLQSREVLALFLALLALMRSSDFNDSVDNLCGWGWLPPYFSLLADLLEDPVFLFCPAGGVAV